MALTQKYKQQQQQVRVLTNESSYLKGMYFSDVPLAEGYSKVLVNFDIDSLSGKIKPRKGLEGLGIIKPNQEARQYLNNRSGYNTVAASKVCAASDTVDPRKINRYLQAIVYNTDTRSLLATTCDPEISDNNVFKAEPFSVDSEQEYISPEPFVIPNPGVHGKACIHNNFFKKPVGAFAFGGSYYTFIRHSKYLTELISELPNAVYLNKDGEPISTYVDLRDNSSYSTGGNPGSYFKFVSGESTGVLAYYDAKGNIQIWDRSEEDLLKQSFPDAAETDILCYTRLGVEIKQDPEIILLDTELIREDLEDDKYYVCVVQPDKLNPTEASSWGYNMLLEDPYAFVCEDTAVNLVTILGMLPYDKDGNITLTPRKNQEITLKGFYRAPAKYFSDAQNLRSYPTTKQKIKIETVVEQYVTTEPDLMGNVYYIAKEGTEAYGKNISYGYIVYKYTVTDTDGQETVKYSNSPVKYFYWIDDDEVYHRVDADDLVIDKTQTVTEMRDPKTKEELDQKVPTSAYAEHAFGDWWYCSEEDTYYMIIPNGLNGTQYARTLANVGNTQPAASVQLTLFPTGEGQSPTESRIRVRWQIRSAGASDWMDIFNEVFTLSEYYNRQGDHAPFTITTTMPENEVLVKLTITDVDDVEESSGEEFVLSTNTIGLSLVSDELANTLNLTAKNFDLGKCTGMCEWEQRLVLWGVPGALNTLFVSDVNNPTFFPYPNNVDIFTDPIIAVHNYGDELLVLTTSALYRLIWDTEGTGWAHKLVQQNLHVTEEDTYMSCVIKNMFFFKSGEYFYMMVPKTTSAASVRGEVAIAPISKPIENLLDNFHKEVYNLIKVMVDQRDLPDFTNKLVNYFSYVDNTRVVVNYVYALADETDITKSKYLYIQLIYDTDARTWSIRAFEAAHMLYASHADAIQQDRFIDLTPALNGDQLVLQYYKFINIVDQSIQYIDDENTNVNAARIIKNYQYLDTGNREINTELKKRFREFQFKLKNVSNTNLGFFTSFLIDGSLRKDLQRYSPRLLLDPKSNEATIIVERVLDTKTMTYNTTRVERILIPERMLQDDGELTPTTLAEEKDPDRWILNQSAFPGRTLWKIRMPISGKGLSPRVILLSTNEADYEILGHDWVYRTMNGR